MKSCKTLFILETFFFPEISTCSCNSLPTKIIHNLLLSWGTFEDSTHMATQHTLSFIYRYHQKIMLN